MVRARQVAETIENFPTVISGLTLSRASGASDVLVGVTLGWVDKRGA